MRVEGKLVVDISFVLDVLHEFKYADVMSGARETVGGARSWVRFTRGTSTYWEVSWKGTINTPEYPPIGTIQAKFVYDGPRNRLTGPGNYGLSLMFFGFFRDAERKGTLSVSSSQDWPWSWTEEDFKRMGG